MVKHTCPTCGHVTATYRRRLHSEMVVFLAKLDKLCRGNQTYFSPRSVLPGQSKASTDAVYMRHWGLIEAQQHGTTVKRGHYRVTEAGKEFLRDNLKVAAWVELRNNKPVAWAAASEMVYASDVYGSRFNADEVVMAAGSK